MQVEKGGKADMDYKYLIKLLRHTVEHGDEEPREYCTNRCGKCELCDQAADTIETLLEERDAAIKFLKSSKIRCDSCAYNYHSIHDYPCKHCKETGGMSDYWKWCCPQEGENCNG